MLHIFLCLTVVSFSVDCTNQPLSDQAPSHSATDSQSFRFSENIFSQSAFAGGRPRIFFFFYPGPGSAHGGPAVP